MLHSPTLHIPSAHMRKHMYLHKQAWLCIYCGCFPHSSVDKESACNAGDPGSIPGSGRSSGEGKVYPLQYSGLENSMDCIVHGVTRSLTQLSNFHSLTTDALQHVYTYIHICTHTHTHMYMGFPGGSAITILPGKKKKYSACNARDWALIPGSGRSSKGGHGNHSSILA